VFFNRIIDLFGRTTWNFNSLLKHRWALRGKFRIAGGLLPAAVRPMSNGCVYIVDDDFAMRDSLEMLLASEDYDTRLFRDGNEFLQAAPFLSYGVLIVDLQMPGMDGLEMLDRLRARKMSFPVVVITGFGNITVAVRAMRAGAIDFV